MANDAALVYWDSCVFIDAHQKTPERLKDILSIEDQARHGGVKIVTSALTIAEVNKLDKNKPPTDAEIRQIAEYFRHKFMTIRPVDRPIGKLASELARTHSIKPPDAIHLATAIKHRCAVLYTYDGDGVSDKKGLLQIGQVDAVKICRPGAYGQKSMF